MDERNSVLTENEKPTKNFNDFYQDFKPATLEALDSVSLANKDYNWRIKNRGIFAWTIMAILIVQNLLIYLLIHLAFLTQQLAALQWILGALLSGTLVET